MKKFDLGRLDEKDDAEANKEFEMLLYQQIERENTEKWSKGLPIARYDFKKKQAFLEWPDGRREYPEKNKHNK